jgi:hypothetical protein
MKKIISAVGKFFKDILLGFKISEELKKKSNWGKF